MSLAAKQQHRLDRAVGKHSEYKYIGDKLSDKTLVTFIAPSATGKSRLINEILQRGADMDISEVGSLTTRQKRNGDPENYQTDVSLDTMLDYIENSALVNWSLFPTGHIYASAPESFSAEYNLMPLIPSSLPMLRKAGFKAVHAIYLTTPMEQWDTQLDERRDDPKFTGRMQEAVTSLEFAKDSIDSLTVLSNHEGNDNLKKLASHILSSIQNDTPISSDPEAIRQIDDMLLYAYEASDGPI